MNIAVVLAGGTGSRLGADKPKQFIEVDGRTVIERCIDAFEAAPGIDEIAVVMHPDWIGHMQEVAAQNGWKKVKKILEGGNERYMSSLNAIAAYLDYPDDTNLLLHDAARPWVSQEVIPQLSKFIARIPERKTMWRAQTPQAFRLPLIRDAYQRALQDPQFHATDDCGVVRQYLPGTKIVIVPGEEQNRKITFKEDLT